MENRAVGCLPSSCHTISTCLDQIGPTYKCTLEGKLFRRPSYLSTPFLSVWEWQAACSSLVIITEYLLVFAEGINIIFMYSYDDHISERPRLGSFCLRCFSKINIRRISMAFPLWMIWNSVNSPWCKLQISTAELTDPNHRIFNIGTQFIGRYVFDSRFFDFSSRRHIIGQFY